VIRGGAGRFTADRQHAVVLVDAIVHGSAFPSFNEEFLRANPFARRYKPIPGDTNAPVVSGAEAPAALRGFLRTTIVPAGSGPQLLSVSHPAMPTRKPGNGAPKSSDR
jgi:hypothetical protein